MGSSPRSEMDRLRKPKPRINLREYQIVISVGTNCQDIPVKVATSGFDNAVGTVSVIPVLRETVVGWNPQSSGLALWQWGRGSWIISPQVLQRTQTGPDRAKLNIHPGGGFSRRLGLPNTEMRNVGAQSLSLPVLTGNVECCALTNLRACGILCILCISCISCIFIHSVRFVLLLGEAVAYPWHGWIFENS